MSGSWWSMLTLSSKGLVIIDDVRDFEIELVFEN
jgi:hypothetical protein